MTELETMQRAKTYIDKLANGIDPLTDEAIRDDSVINNVRISRCLFYVSGVLEKAIANGGEFGKKYILAQLPFTIAEYQLEKIYISEEPVGISVFVKRIADVLDENVKNIPATHITAWLCQNGYLTEETVNNKKRKIATAKGETIGIVTIDGANQSGMSYKKNVYTANAQRFIVSNLVKIAEETV